MRNAFLSFTIVGLAFASTQSRANVLNFDDLSGTLANYDDIPVNYGTHSGDTTHIGVSYETVTGGGAHVASNLDFWHDNYGDLHNVPFAVNNGDYARIILTPDAGYTVTLNSFDFAGYGGTQFNQTLHILNGSGTSLLDYSPIDFPGTGHASENPNLSSTGPLIIEWGPSWNGALDNISFSERLTAPGVPDSGNAAVLLGLGTALLFGARQQLARQKE